MKHLLLAGALLLAPTLAHAQCAPHDRTAKLLEGKHHEAVIGEGVSRGRKVELWASETGSWSVLVVFPNGVSCLALSGTGWESIDPKRGERI